LITKWIVCNNKSFLTPENKELAYAYSFYTFRQRLQYKCISKKCNYKEVKEWYTSKTCSFCSEYNENLGGNKVFNCSFCNSKFDRDINSCRNIIIKCL
jgi:transposase